MSKRTISLLMFVLCLTAVTAYAQDETDALRYSRLTTGGSARIQAIGGAVGALGGDITSLSVNPAGIGLFKTNDFSVTPGLFSWKNNAGYLGTSATDSKSNFNLTNLGAIFAINKQAGSQSGWQNFTIGLAVNRLANFNSNMLVAGANKTSSWSEKYIEELGTTDPNAAAQNYPFGPSLALNTYLLDPVYNSNGQLTGYSSNVFTTTGTNQQNNVSTSGGINEFSLGIAGNYGDKFYIGGDLNLPSIKYDRTNYFSEIATQPSSSFQSFNVTETLSTTGAGINGKFGVIYRLADNLRIGGAFHTPTLYSMSDTYTTGMTTNTASYKGTMTQNSSDLTNGYPGQYKYKLVTPWHAVASISYLFGTNPDVKEQKGFISLDYEYVDYAATHFQFDKSNPGDAQQESSVNSSISSIYKGASNIRLGGELKFNILAVRAGIAWYGNPYQSSYTTVDGSRFLYSAGLGVRNKGMYAALTYVYTAGKDIYYPYSLADKTVAPADISNTGGNVLLTVGFKF